LRSTLGLRNEALVFDGATQDVGNGSQKLTFFGSEMALVHGMHTKDTVGAVSSLDHHTHSAHYTVIAKELGTREPALACQIINEDRPVR
jgi:hypothetical protein